MTKKVVSVINDPCIFWDCAKDYINHQLPDIQKASPNTVSSYRSSLNSFINYLEVEKNIQRENLTFKAFNRANIKEFFDWLLNNKKLADKTCNLRLTAIHSFLEYASNEYSIDLMNLYISSCSVKCLKQKDKAIKYFESTQMKKLLSAPDTSNKTGRRNQMMLIMYYDTGARNTELREMNINQLHLDAEIPYVTILGKGRKYRNVPLMEKTLEHLKKYLNEFHANSSKDTPLFYTTTYGKKHFLSSDTVEEMIKAYSKKCEVSGVEMPEEPRCHMIRKTRAMDLYRKGTPLSHIQQFLGHKNCSTTTGFYTFATLDTLAKAMEKANSDCVTNDVKWKDPEIQRILYRL